MSDSPYDRLKAELYSPDVDVAHWPAACRDWAFHALAALDDAEIGRTANGDVARALQGLVEPVPFLAFEGEDSVFGPDARCRVCGYWKGHGPQCPEAQPRRLLPDAEKPGSR